MVTEIMENTKDITKIISKTINTDIISKKYNRFKSWIIKALKIEVKEEYIVTIKCYCNKNSLLLHDFVIIGDIMFRVLSKDSSNELNCVEFDTFDPLKVSQLLNVIQSNEIYLYSRTFK